MNSNESILIVDDESNILDGFQRSLGRSFKIRTAVGGKAGLADIEARGPFAVIITDMRMPEVDGLMLLREAHRISPHSVCIMLTGNSDQKTAVDAVNVGQVFRFLTKPCSREVMEEAVRSALEFYRLKENERLLLAKTVAGCVKTLLQLLQMTKPMLFARSGTVARIAQWLAKRIGYAHPWQVEIAGGLSAIGCLTLTDDDLSRGLADPESHDPKTEEFRKQASAGGEMFKTIPRFEEIAAIIEMQFDDPDSARLKAASPTVMEGVRILSIAKALDVELQGTLPWSSFAGRLEGLRWMTPQIAFALAASPPEWIVPIEEASTTTIHVDKLTQGMIVLADVRTQRGELLTANGSVLTDVMCDRIRNFARSKQTNSDVVVLDPKVRVSKVLELASQ